MNSLKIYYQFILCLLVIFMLSSCGKFVELDTPNGTIPAAAVFETDASATAAVMTLYNNGNWRDAMLYTTFLSGMSADELVYFSSGNLLEFQNNTIDPGNLNVANYAWFFPYSEITNSNINIEGLTKSQSLSPAVKDQLIGESKFWRAMAYFQLVNTFGGVPLALSAEPIDNAFLPRNTAQEVFDQIFADLKDAKALLKPAYPTTERARVNQYAVSALLARVYLYQKDWANAEAEASSVIASNTYSLSDPVNTFVKTSNETILQIFTINGFTSWGTNFVPATATSGNPNYFLRTGFVDAFEGNDARRANWVSPIGTGVNPDYAIRKYKLRSGTTAGNEYYVVLRLAEQYLIRAEARARQNNLSGAGGAESDLNAVRSRALLEPRLDLSQSAMLLAIEQERKVELFGEWGHRWFDLKRSAGISDPSKTRADEVLSVVKGANWQSTDILFPIPAGERTKNTALTQNPGYAN